MKIYELLKQLNDRFPTSTDKERMIENLFRKRGDLHICDLDLALIFIGITVHFKSVDARSFFGQRKELIAAIVDSSFAKIFAPEMFLGDVTTVDDDERCEDVTKAVIEAILNMDIKKVAIDAIDHHE